MTGMSANGMQLVALWAAVVTALVIVLACMGVFMALVLRMSAAF